MFTEAEAAEALDKATETLEYFNEMARWHPLSHSSHTLFRHSPQGVSEAYPPSRHD
jgi:hypothetical protein